MTQEELRNLVVVSGHECRVEKDEVVLHVCTYCGNAKWNLELNADKGFFKCWACNMGGRLDVFLERMTGRKYNLPVNERTRGPKPTRITPESFQSLPAKDVHSAAHYLAVRGITPAEATSFGLVVCVEKGHALYGRLCIPALDYFTGAVLGWSARSYTGGHPKYLSTLEHRVVTGWRSRVSGALIVVVEGHLDGIAVRRVGYSAAVLGGISSPALADWAGRLLPDAKVVVMLDGTAQAQAVQLYWALRAIHGEAGVTIATLDEEQDPASLGPDGVRAVINGLTWPVAGT